MAATVKQEKEDDWLREWHTEENHFDFKDGAIKKDMKNDNDSIKSEDISGSKEEPSEEIDKADRPSRRRRKFVQRTQITTKAKMKELLQRTTETTKRVGNFCKFICPSCHVEYRNWYTLRKHWRRSTKTSCSKANLESSLVKAVCHTCNICKGKVLNDYYFLENHFGGKHRMKVKDYCQGHGVTSTLNEVNFRGFFAGELRAMSSETTDAVGSFCKFLCQCGKTFNTYMSFMKHENKLGHQRGDDLKDWAVRVATHVCRICNDEIVSDTVFLCDHMRSKHSCKLKDYVAKFGLEASGPMAKSIEKGRDWMEGVKLTDKVGACCRFRCAECHSEFPTLGGLNRHVTVRGHGRTTYGRDTLEGCIIEKVGHRCRGCGEVVLSDPLFLLNHLRSRHGIKALSVYRRKFDLESTGSILDRLATDVDTLNTESQLSDEIANKCHFRCPDCHLELPSLAEMMTHARKTRNHRTSRLAEWKKCVKVENRKLYKCKICDFETLCDNGVFGRHLYSRHRGMTLAKYKERFQPEARNFSLGIENACEFACTECKANFSDYHKLWHHMKKSNHMHNVEEKRKMTKKILHRCRLCLQDITCQQIRIRRHLVQHHDMSLADYAERYKLDGLVNSSLREYLAQRTKFVQAIPVYQSTSWMSKSISKATRHVGDLCRYECTQCGEGFFRWANMNRHLKLKHGNDSIDVRDCLVEARYHKCLLCKKAILCDSSAVGRHVTSTHGQTWKSYTRLVAKSGASVFPSYWTFCAEGKNVLTQPDGEFGLKSCSVVLKRL